MSLALPAIHALEGEVYLPGSKSMSNRALLMAAMAEGDTLVKNLLVSDDTKVMLAALTKLGVIIVKTDDGTRVTGLGGPLAADGTEDTELQLNLGLAGTAIRPLCAALTLGRGTFTLDGVARMRERPIGDLIQPLLAMGANIEYLATPGFPPIKIQGTGLTGGKLSMRGDTSSQFLTSLLMACPYADNPTNILIEGELVSKPYIDITCNMMSLFGVEVDNENNRYLSFQVSNQKYQSPGEVLVEGDASSASYFLAAGAIAGKGVCVHGIGKDSVQGDVAFTDVITQMGANIQVNENSIEVCPGTTKLKAIDADLGHITDAAMTVAVLALFAEGTTRIRNIGNWRVKETDRLAAMSTELRKFGATVIEGEDSLEITPPEKLNPATVATYGDHRMAMGFSLTALGTEVTIENPDCVGKTFPDYFEVFKKLSVCS